MKIKFTCPRHCAALSCIRCRILAALCVAGVAISLAGCGGSASKNGGSSFTDADGYVQRSGTGRATFTVTWPGRPASNARLIPVLSNSIRVDVDSNGVVAASQLLVRPYPSSAAAQVGTITFTSLPVGAYTVVATAFPNADGTGTAQATGSVAATVVANATVAFSLTMGSTISQIDLATLNSGATLPATLIVNGTLALTAMAVDASGNTVIANLQWTAVNAAGSSPGTGSPVASVDANGNVTALMPGVSTIAVTDPESGESASTNVTVTSTYSATDIGTPGSNYSLDVFGLSTNSMNDSGQVVSSFFDGEKHYGFLYTPTSGWKNLGNLGGTGDTYAYGVSDSGSAVGMSSTASGASHAFVFANGVMNDIGTLGGDDSAAVCINSSGQIAGTSKTSSGLDHAFLYSNGAMIDLDSPNDAEGSADGINASGAVTGSIGLVTTATGAVQDQIAFI